MHPNPKSFLNGLGQLLGSERGIFDALLENKIHHFAGQLVPALRPSFVREQAEDTVLLERRLRLLEGGTREAEGARSFADGLSIHVNVA